MNKSLVIVVVIVVLLFTFFIFFQNNEVIKKNKKMDNNEWRLIRNTILSYESIHQNISHFPIEGISDSVLCEFNDCVSNQAKLIVLVPSTPCKDCITKELDMIRSLGKKIGENRILFLTQFPKKRDSKLWAKTWDIEFPIYNNSGQKLFSKIQEQDLLSLFVLDSIMIPKHLFIPISGLPDLSKKYYKFVKSIFTSNDTTHNKISFDKLKYNFGNIKYGEPQSVTFFLTNDGDSPLIISNIETTCGCTVPTWDKSPIPPESTREISVLYKADKLGFFQQKIFVFLNAKNSPHGLIITGKVEK